MQIGYNKTGINYSYSQNTRMLSLAQYKADSTFFTGNNKKSENPSFDIKSDILLYKLTPKPIRDIKFKTVSKDCLKAAQDSITVGKITEKEFDSKYGKNNYSFVSIGTSPACVARYFELLGLDVKYVPLSGVRDIAFPVESLADYQDYDKYSKYLDSIGLFCEKVNNGDKKQVFCDFTCSRKTLETVRYFAKYKRGLNENKTDYVSLNEILLKYAEKNPESKQIIEDYISSLSSSSYSKYSGIPHLYCMCVDNIEELAKTKQSKEARDFNFSMMYLLEKNGDLRI